MCDSLFINFHASYCTFNMLHYLFILLNMMLNNGWNASNVVGTPGAQKELLLLILLASQHLS